MTTNSVNRSNEAANLTFCNQMDTPAKNSLGQQDFLRLMVEQIQNQSPMQAQLNSDFLSQLARFSTNDGVAQMQESLQSNQALQASALVGRKVVVNGNRLKRDTTGSVTIAVDIPPGLSKLSATIYSEFGELIKTIPLGQPATGFFQFSWDGIGEDRQPMNDDTYKVEVNAVYEMKELSLKTMICANVDSVSIGQNGEGLKLNVDGIGAVSLDQVRQISV
ncbi:MAG: flagellar hook assembly protein FlgD [Legionella longbeachae]|nr:flagellar hook assembly protein FlgD [Legionella longbeachae]